MAEDETAKEVSMNNLESEVKEGIVMGKVSDELRKKDKAVKSTSMEELEASAMELLKVSSELMAEDAATSSVSMEELEAEASDAKIGGLKYQNIIDTLHQLKLSDEDIKKLPADAVTALNAYGALGVAAKLMFDPKVMEEKNKQDMALLQFLATHEDPFKELYEAAAKK